MEEITDPSKLTYDAKGLIPCVVQQYDTGEVLMVAWMNEESVGLTLKTGTTWFWSRSRQELWNKGVTSGNMQAVKELWADCDSDTLLVKVDSPVRPATPATVPASLRNSRRAGARLDARPPERIEPWVCAPQTFRMEISVRR